jgi:mannose-1-phosphate guanylyltransferase/phosphomannomutase
MVSLILRGGQKGTFAVPVSAPSVIEMMASEKGCAVLRTKTTERAMIEASQASEVIMAGSMDGRFAFPRFQAGFDGMFTIVKMVELLASCGVTLSAVHAEIPHRTFLQSRITCAWEMKGGIMRKMSEDSLDCEATFIDGIKVHIGEDWVLVLPDQYQPFVNIIAEGKDPKAVHKLLTEYQKKVEKWKKELQ